MARDWLCARCGGSNATSVAACQHCGLLRGAVAGATRTSPSDLSTPLAPNVLRTQTARPRVDVVSAERAQTRVAMSALMRPAGVVVGRPARARRSRWLAGAFASAVILALFVARTGSQAPSPRSQPTFVDSGVAPSVRPSPAGAADTPSTPSPSPSAPSGETISIDGLRVGDCFDAEPVGTPDANGALTYDLVSRVACGVEHAYEVFGLATLREEIGQKSGTTPSDKQIDDAAWALCLPLFTRYVGVSFDLSELDASDFYPAQEGWASGDRAVTCWLSAPPDGLTTTMRGWGR